MLAGGQLLEGTDATLSPRPVQQPHPRLWIAAFGPLALKQAAGLPVPIPRITHGNTEPAANQSANLH